MDANEVRLKEKLELHLKEATRIAVEIQALEQGNQVPHFDQIELPAHQLGKRFSRAIQEERAREVALKDLGRVYCPDCKKQCKVEIEPRSVNSFRSASAVVIWPLCAIAAPPTEISPTKGCTSRMTAPFDPAVE
jgi:hypothetical protein